MSSDLQEQRERLSAFIQQEMEEHRIPGVAAGIYHEGATWVAGFGVTSVDHPLPVTEETLFQIGSITKTLTATAIMHLVEMEKLELDAPVQTYLPDFKVSDEIASTQATIRHLLTHTSGWQGDFFLDTGAGSDALARYVTDMADLPQLAPLGAVFSYCNSGFTVAGRVIESVTAKTYEEALKELVLEPLDLGRCFFEPGAVITHRFAVGHHVENEGPQVARPWPLPRAVYAAGGIVCDIRELLSYGRFHMGDGTATDGTELLTEESLSLMRSTQQPIWGDRSMGLAWFVRDLKGTSMVSHGGGTTGQVALLAMFPDHDLAVAVLTNADRGRMLTQGVVSKAAQELLGLDVPVSEPAEAPEEELSVYAGQYSRPFADLELGMLCGKLVGQLRYKGGFPTQDTPPPPPPPPATFALCEEDCLIVTDGPMNKMLAEVLRTPQGAISYLRFGLRLFALQELRTRRILKDGSVTC